MSEEINTRKLSVLQENQFVELVNQLISGGNEKCTIEKDYEYEDDYKNDITLNGKKYLLDDNAAKVLNEIKKIKHACFSHD